MHTNPKPSAHPAKRLRSSLATGVIGVVVLAATGLATTGCAGNLVHSYRSPERPRPRGELLGAVRPTRPIRRRGHAREDRRRPGPHWMHIAQRHQERLTTQRSMPSNAAPGPGLVVNDRLDHRSYGSGVSPYATAPSCRPIDTTVVCWR
jgi:hypothetical protein